MPGISTDPSLRKIFELKYPRYGQWNVMTNTNILGRGRHDIVMSQSMHIPIIPGCFDTVDHGRIDERQTFSEHKCTFSSSLHWFEKQSGCFSPVVMPDEGREKGFMVTCMGHSIKIEDSASKTCCRDQRDVCYVVAPLAQGGMEFARKLALNTFYDCLVETQAIVDRQPTGGDFGCPVIFTSSADAVQMSPGVFAGDKAAKCMDQTMIMFLGNCFFMCRAMVHLQSMDNFSAKGSYWQASSFFTDEAFVCIFLCSFYRHCGTMTYHAGRNRAHLHGVLHLERGGGSAPHPGRCKRRGKVGAEHRGSARERRGAGGRCHQVCAGHEQGQAAECLDFLSTAGFDYHRLCLLKI